jgi:hypothetical protein
MFIQVMVSLIPSLSLDSVLGVSVLEHKKQNLKEQGGGMIRTLIIILLILLMCLCCLLTLYLTDTIRPGRVITPEGPVFDLTRVISPTPFKIATLTPRPRPSSVP